MKKAALAVTTAFLFCAAMAVAQDSNPSSSNSQGTTGSSPSMSQGSSAPSGSQGGEMKGGEMKSDKDMKSSKGEKTLKGCIKSEGGSYVLEEGHGKEVMLSGADVSAHANHEVKVHGSYDSSAMSNSSTGSEAKGEKGVKTFNVTSVDMVSETCTMGGKKSKGSMSSAPSSTQPPQ